MSDDKKEDWPIVTVDDIAAFHADLNVSAVCPCCESVDWNVAIGADPISGNKVTAVIFAPLHLANSSNLPPTDRSMPFYSISCEKCGFTRLHNMHKINKWKRSKTEGATK